MSGNQKRFSGAAYAVSCVTTPEGEPLFAGYCFCADCRKASGSGGIPFMGFASAAVRISGPKRQFQCKSIKGTDAVPNFCPTCGGLVFGGEFGKDTSHTI
jgi:hypothetical protein